MFPLSVPAGILAINIGIVVFVAAIMVAVFFTVRGGARIFGVAVSGVVLLLLFYLFIVAPEQVYVAVEDTLRINAPPYARMELGRDQVRRAYVVDWSENEDLRPVAKTNGMATGTYRVGWFVLGNGRKALLVTAGTRVVCLETDDIFLLLAPDRFEEFVEALTRRFRVEGL